MTAPICKGLEEREVYGVIGYRRPTHREGYLRKREFHYEAGLDGYRCPGGQLLTYHTTNREGYRDKLCRECPLLASCTQNAQSIKTVTRHVWEESRERV
jgi:hypothetical protein